jgi:hypothetical protein
MHVVDIDMTPIVHTLKVSMCFGHALFLSISISRMNPLLNIIASEFIDKAQALFILAISWSILIHPLTFVRGAEVLRRLR